MKTHFSRIFLAIAGAALLALPAHAAKVDFSDFAGKYKSTYLIQIDGSAAFGNINTTVKVPRSGRSATISLRGTVFAMGTPILVSGSIRMKSNGKLKTNSPVMGLLGPVATKPSRFKGRASKFTFKAVTQPGAVLNGSSFFAQMTYTLRFNGDSVSLSGSGITNDPPVPLTIKIQGDR